MNRKTDRLDGLVLIGEVVRPHGIRGEVKVYLFSEQPGNFKDYERIVLQGQPGGVPATYNVVSSQEQGKLAIVRLEGVDTREAAETLLGSGIWLSEADFPKLAEEEYYWHQLKGLAVETESGRSLGRVTRLFNTAAHDIMVVSGTGQEFLIPVQKEIIREIDRQEGKVIISPLPGLLEMNE